MAAPQFGEIEFERRVFPRFIIHLPVTYEKEDGVAAGEGVTQDASLGGLQIFTSESLAPGDQLRIKLSLSEGNRIQTIQARARVVWRREVPDQTPKPFKVGLEFVDITDEALKYLKWFEQLWLNQSS